jgi:hypothetical protein
MSLSTVISDLEAEGTTGVATACFLTSKSVTSQQRIALLEAVLGDHSSNEDVTGTPDTWKAAAAVGGLALAQPSSVQEVATSATACGGTILYAADPIDLSRGEGLFETLGPAIEKMLAADCKASLYVLTEGNAHQVKTLLEDAAAQYLSNLISDKPVQTLQDVFSKIEYVSPSQAADVITADNRATPEGAMELVAEVVAAESSLPYTVLSTESSAPNLAAARVLGPAARRKLRFAVEQVRAACTGEDGSQKLVPGFGQLCDAAIKRALSELEEETVGPVLKSQTGQQIRANMLADLDGELSEILEEQLGLLQLASFDEFKRGLTKLLISPNLASDMDEQVKKSLWAFQSATKKLVAKKSSWSVQHAIHQYRRLLKEHVAERILAARASGKFRPLPRKGVTVGFHWLLPKPFGNDYRQEPWMVHASDNLVYVPKDKITDVSPEEVAAGDWRNKIVPSPVGNDMLYMQ